MKVIIQIPCFNEEQALPVTLSQLPRELPGIASVEWMVVDDGSTDRTIQVAKDHGVDYVYAVGRHVGLARAFSLGINHALSKNADIIVNTDADNQYCAEDIEKLIIPILTGNADLVIGARSIFENQEFSLIKKILQKIGSWVVRRLSGTNVVDAPSGFRAFRREYALCLQIFNSFSYTLESIIQAGRMGYRVVSVPIRTNATFRPSRLAHSSFAYIFRSFLTIAQTIFLYYSIRIFSVLGAMCFLIGSLLNLRYLYLFMVQNASGHIQSLILGSVFLSASFFLFTLSVVCHLLGINRNILEEVHACVRQNRYVLQQPPFEWHSVSDLQEKIWKKAG